MHVFSGFIVVLRCNKSLWNIYAYFLELIDFGHDAKILTLVSYYVYKLVSLTALS